MIKIKIHNNSETNAQGTSTRGNRKSIYCITTGEVYASQTDAARILGVNHSSISWVVTGRMKTVNGLRFCYCSAITDHFDEIAEAARNAAQKAAAYDAIIAEQERETRRREEEQKARDQLAMYQAKREKLRAELEKIAQLEIETEAKINSFMN